MAEETKRRPLWLMPLVIAGLSFPCGAYTLHKYDPPPPKSMAELQEGFDEEIALLEGIGLREVARGDADLLEHEWAHEHLLEGGQCIGVVVAAATAYPVALALRHEGALLAGAGAEQHVNTVTWCEEYATRVSVLADFDGRLRGAPLTAQTREGTLQWAIFAGRTDRMDLLTLPRGRPSEERVRGYRERLEAERLRNREAEGVPMEPSLLDPVEVPRDRVLLLPRSEGTLGALRAGAVTGTTLTPDEYGVRVHVESPASTRRPVDENGAAPPTVRLGEELWRVVAVADPADLPAEGDAVPCARLRFGRLKDGGAVMMAVSAADWSERDVPSPSPGIAIDTFCPDAPITIYAVPPSDHASYRVRLHSAEGPTRRRNARPAPAVPEAPRLTELRASCDVGSIDDCIALARIFRDGTLTAADPATSDLFFELSCDAAHEDVCLEWSEALHPRSIERSLTVIRESCERGHAHGCALLGDRYRMGDGVAFDAERARELYESACPTVDAACANLRGLDLMEL